MRSIRSAKSGSLCMVTYVVCPQPSQSLRSRLSMLRAGEAPERRRLVQSAVPTDFVTVSRIWPLDEPRIDAVQEGKPYNERHSNQCEVASNSGPSPARRAYSDGSGSGLDPLV